MALRRTLCALAFLAAAPAAGAPVSWTGGGDGATWADPANWSPAGVPGAASDVTISSGARVDATAAAAVVAASLDLGGASTAQLRLSTGTLVAGLLRVSSGSVLSFLSTHTARAGTFSVSSGGLVEQYGPVSQSTTAVTISADVFDLQAGATVQATGRGFPGGSAISAGTGPGGGGSGSGGRGAGGGGHGGAGGNGGLAVNGGSAYGTVSLPATLGSGGGGGLAPCFGGAGGGLLTVTAGTATVNGAFLADGTAGAGGCSQAGGGGSGGAILLRAAVLSGTGSMLARGAAGGSGGAGPAGGGGGGGRVAIVTTGLNLATIAISSGAGAGGPGTPPGSNGGAGSAFVDPKVWTGAGSSDCKDSANWVGNVAPQAFENAVFGSTASAKSCTWDFGNLPIGTLTLESGYQGTLVWNTLFSSVTGRFEMRGGTLSVGSLEMKMGGDFVQTGGTFTLTAGTVTMTGFGKSLSVLPGMDFNHLLVETGASLTLASSVSIRGNMTVKAGSTMTVSAGVTARFGGDLTQLGRVDSGGSRYILDGTSVQRARWGSFGSLSVVGSSGAVLLPGLSTKTAVAGDLEVAAGSSLSAGLGRIELSGNWSSSGTFSASGATVAFVGPGAQSILAGATSFHYLELASPGGVTWATAVAVSSGVTFVDGLSDLGTATHSFRGALSASSGSFRGSSGTVLLDGTAAQRIAASSASVFGHLVSSNPAGVVLAADAAVEGPLELFSGAFDISGRVLRLGEGLYRRGGPGPTTASSTVRLEGASLQELSLAGAALDSLVVANSSAGAFLRDALVLRGTFTVLAGAVFDGGASSISVVGSSSGWVTAGAVYTSSSAHRVLWQSPAGGRVLVSSASSVTGQVDVRGAVRLSASMTLSTGAINLFPGGTLDSRGSTLTLREAGELYIGPGSAYLHDAGSWLVYSGSGTDRGALLSTGPVGNILFAADSATTTFRFGSLAVDGTLRAATGTVRLSTGARMTLGGDLVSAGGVFDFASVSSATLVMTGSALQRLEPGPQSALRGLEVASSSSVAVAPGTALRVRGALALTSGRLEASDASFGLEGDWAGAGGTFAAQRSTVSFLSASTQAYADKLHQAFNGLSAGPGARVFSASFDAAVFSATQPSAGITFSTSGLHVLADLRVNGTSTGTPVDLRSALPGTPFRLSVQTSTMSAAAVRDADATAGALLYANDGLTRDDGGNSGIEFRPTLLVIAPGETFVAGTGRTGTALVQTAGSSFTVTVHAVSNAFLPVRTSTAATTVHTGDTFDTEPSSAALSAGSAAFPVTLRVAEPAPATSLVWAQGAGAAGTAGSTVTVQAAAYSSLQVLVPGEAALPGSPAGRTGTSDFQILSRPFSVLVRAVDPFGNLISTLTDTVSISLVASASPTLPSPQALSGGSVTLSGLTIRATGLYTISAADASNAGVPAAQSSTFSVFSLSASSPVLSFSLPSGAALGTLSGRLAGGAQDSVSVTDVSVGVRDGSTGLWYDWASSFSAASTVFRSAGVTPFRGTDVEWILSFPDSVLTSGRDYFVLMRASNPAGLATLLGSTFTFNRGILQFSPADGEGTAAVLPVSTGACQAVVTTVTFTVGNSGLGRGGAVALRIPPGWTPLAGLTAAVPPPLGYAAVVSTSLAWSVAGSSEVLFAPPSIGSVTLGSDWLAVRVASAAPNLFKPGEDIRFYYTGYPPARAVGRHLLDVRSRSAQSGTLVAVASAPAVALAAGPASGLEFSDRAPIALGPLQGSATMQLFLTDGCGNPAVSTLAVVIGLSAGQPAASGFSRDLSAAFYAAGGAGIVSVTVSTGQSASPAFYMTTSTSGVDSESVRATATLAGSAVDALRTALIRASSVAPTAVSVDTGTLSAGATSVLLVPGAGSAVVRFSVTDPAVPWDVAVATEASFTTPLARSAGTGDASSALSYRWDAVACARACSFVAPGRYPVRVRAGGNPGTSVEVRVATSPFISGSLGTSGAGAFVSVEGPGAGYGSSATADSSGAFKVWGLHEGARYAVRASSFVMVQGVGVRLSTAVCSVAASTAGGAAGSPSFAVPGLMRVNASVPVLSPEEVFGSVLARGADGSAAASGVLHFPRGGASSDDGAVALGASASTWTVLALPPGVYTLEVEVARLGLSTRPAAVTVSTSATADVSLALDRRAALSGTAVLVTTSAYGTSVAVAAAPSGSSVPTRFASLSIPAASSGTVPSSGVFRLYGLTQGSWTLTARAPGLLPATTTLFVSGTADIGDGATGQGGPALTLGLGAVLRGTVTVQGDSRGLAGTGPAPDAASSNGFSVLVEAFEPRLLRRESGIVRLSTDAAQSAAQFQLGGLEPGLWDVRAVVSGFEKTPAGDESVRVTSAGASVGLVYARPSARGLVSVRIEPPASPCSCSADFARLALLHTDPFGAQTAVAVATALAGASFQFYPSSLTMTTPALASGINRWTFLDPATGRSASAALSLTPAATAEALLDLSGGSKTVSGLVRLTGPVRISSTGYSVTVSSLPGLVAFAARAPYCLLSSSSPVTLSAARVELVPVGDGSAGAPGPLARAGQSCASWSPSVAARTPAIAYVGALAADGSFLIRGVPPGYYRVRIPGDLDGSPGNGDEAAPVEASLAVTADTALDLRLGPGGSVQGALALPAGAPAKRRLDVMLSSLDGTELRRVSVEAAPGSPAAFAVNSLPDGEFVLAVADAGTPRAYGARPRLISLNGGAADAGTVSLEALGSIRLRLALERRSSSGTLELVPIDGSDRTLLPAELRIAAVASPWREGGFFPAQGAFCGPRGCARPDFDAAGTILIGGVFAGVYDVELVPGPGGGVDAAAAVRAGVRVAEGQTAELGVVKLRSAATVAGLLTDSSGGLPAGGVPVTARPSVGGLSSLRRPARTVRSDGAGRFSLGGLDPDVRFYDIVAAARPEDPSEPPPAYDETVIAGVDVLSTAALSIPLRAAPYSVSGRVLAADGGQLLGASDGAVAEPGAELYLYPEGRPPTEGPLGNTVSRTAPDGSFSLSGLSAGAYRLTVEALGCAPRTLPVRVTAASPSLGTITLQRAASLSGVLRRPDGGAPGEDEVRRVFAATADLSEVLEGGLLRDSAGRSAARYRVGGFVPGKTYRLIVLTADDEPYTPPEASALSFSTTTESRVLDVVVRPPAPRITAKSRRSGGAFLIEFNSSRPLRARTAADDDPARLVSTVSASGALSGLELSADRRKVLGIYTPGVSESSFTLRFAARTEERDPDAADSAEFLAVATAAFFSGVDGYQSTQLSNLTGGTLSIEGDPGRVALPKGAFILDASSSASIALRRTDELLLGARGLAAAGLSAEEATRTSLRFGTDAYPAGLVRAMAATPPDVRPAGPYYDVAVSSGLGSRLAKPARLSLGYAAGAEPARLNVYWYNEAANAFVLQQDVTGAPLELDALNKTVSLSVDHFSTFVLFDAAAAVISGNAYDGGVLSAYNFPNPFDLRLKTVTPIHGAAIQTVRGTLVRIAVPAGQGGDGRLLVFSAAGERVRTVDLGQLQGGRSYYQAWDGANDAGKDVASGLYIGQVKVGGRSAFFKMAVLK
ncbi:MAG: hypothetical protein HY928_18305 [Elusimicrobia bacterium]|nr:hypothetical protein [Elusimicrobiota bacterium]